MLILIQVSADNVLVYLVSLRYWNEKYFQALGIIEEAAKREGLTMVEVCQSFIRSVLELHCGI
jgi:hypothetical protein